MLGFGGMGLGFYLLEFYLDGEGCLLRFCGCLRVGLLRVADLSVAFGLCRDFGFVGLL